MKTITRTLRSVVCLTLLCVGAAVASDSANKSGIKVGVYDNRAVTMAYFDSEYNPIHEMRERLQEAHKIGDSAKIQELEAWGPRFQRKIHFQGFCRAPIDDILEHVHDRLAAVMKSTGVDLISWNPDYTSENVVVVDITDDLVKLFNPSAKRLEEIRKLKDIPPTELCDISHDD